jgi:hypothetical protein
MATMVRSALRLIAAAAILFLGAPLVHAQNGPPAHLSRPKLVGPAKGEPSAQEVSAAYWTLEPGWNTDLEMRNNLRSQELTITPVLRAATGQELSLAPVTVAPEQVVSLNLRNLTQTNPKVLSYLGSFGSAVFRFDGLYADNLFAATIVRHEGEPIDFHFDGQEDGPNYNSGGIEGMWWLPAASSTDYLILSNPLKKGVRGTLTFSSAFASHRPIAVSLAPGQTKRINLQEVLGPSSIGGVGGLSLSLPGKELISATQIVFDEVTGLAVIMKMFDRESDDQPKSRELRAPMMALSQPDHGLGFPNGTQLLPRIFLRNAGSASTQVSATVDWRNQGSGTFALPALTLSPGEVRTISLADYQQARQIPLDASWATMKLSYTGRAADLVAVAVSYDKSNRYGLQTPFSEDLSRLWAGGMWHVDATHNTFITTGNAGSEATTAEVTLFYNGGKSRYRMETMLSPGQQLWLDIGRTIRDQVPDSDGKTLPPATMTGSYELRDLDHATVGQLYEGKLVIDKTYGHAAYGCGSCCGYDAVQLSPDAFGGPPGIENDDYIYANDTCVGEQVDVTDSGTDWGSSDTAVATLPNRTLHTVAIGSATGSTLVGLQWAHPPKCPTEDFGPTQSVDVTPTISQSQNLWYFGSGISAPSGFTLGGTSATLTASGGGSGTYAWSITSGSSIAALRGTTSGQNLTTVTIASTSYSTSAKDVTVQLQFTPSGGSTLPVTYSLSVDSPYEMDPDGVTDKGVNSCSDTTGGGTNGYKSQAIYTALSFFGVTLNNIGVNETFGTQVDDFSGNNWPPNTPGGLTIPSSNTFADTICAVGPTLTPAPLTPQTPLSSEKIVHSAQSWFVGSVTSGTGVEVQTDTQQYYIDHGRHLTIVSPVR